MTMMDAHAGTVEAVYGGPVGLVWEILAGEDVEQGTSGLAERAGLGERTRVLALLPGTGGGVRRLVRECGATVIGLVAVPQVADEAVQRIEEAGQIDFQQGNALDMPFDDEVFDAVWGEDAWCYVTDRDRMIREVFRVLKPGGTLAFTDWVETGPMSNDEWHTRATFGIFPHFETIESYAVLLERNGFRIVDGGEVLDSPIRQIAGIHERLEHNRDMIAGLFGEGAYDDTLQALGLWERAAGRGLVGRGWLVARKP